MKPHKHAELIKAWADGAEIESQRNDGTWVIVNPAWSEQCEYRIRPEPKEDKSLYLEYFNPVLCKYCTLHLLLDGTNGDIKETHSAVIIV